MEYSECITGFESAKRITPEGAEYWMARDIMTLLDYADWRNFRSVIDKAIDACRGAGVASAKQFVDVTDKVEIGYGAQRSREDCFLSRYGCYLIAMNADSNKPQVGYAMTYFAVKARMQEVREQHQIGEQDKRLELRLRSIASNKRLAGAAKSAGVTRFGIFQDAGYRGMYGGMSIPEVKKYKGVPDKEDLLDCIGPLELSAHEFRALLAEDRLNRNEVKSESQAIATHRDVGSEVRAVMRKEKGTSPEALPVAPSIKKLVSSHQRRIKANQKALE